MRSNQSVLKETIPEYSLEGLMLKPKLQYFGHLVLRADSLEKTLMLERIEGKRRRGWQRMSWLGNITNSMAMNLGKLQEMVRDSEAWRAAVHGVSKSQMQLSDWTTTSGAERSVLGTSVTIPMALSITHYDLHGGPFFHPHSSASFIQMKIWHQMCPRSPAQMRGTGRLGPGICALKCCATWSYRWLQGWWSSCNQPLPFLAPSFTCSVSAPPETLGKESHDYRSTDGKIWLRKVCKSSLKFMLGITWWSSDAEALILCHWCKEMTYWKRLWCWERLKAKGEVGGRGWDG